jgi:hypothetical protein
VVTTINCHDDDNDDDDDNNNNNMALQLFVGPWQLLSFLILYKVGRTPWTGDQPVNASV